MSLLPGPQEPIAPAVTGNETAADLKTDYSRATSRQVASYLNRDNLILQNLLADGAGGGSNLGAGRFVGRDYTQGRATPAVPPDLLLYLPNAEYQIDGKLVAVNEPGGFALIDCPANMTTGKFGYLSEAPGGGVEVKAEDWIAPVDGAPVEPPPLDLPCIGLVKSNATEVTEVSHTFTDEIQVPALLLQEVLQLRALIDELGGNGGGGTLTRADLVAWSLTDPTTINPKVQELIAESEARLKDYVDGKSSKVMQTDNDYMIEFLMKIAAALIRVSPETADLLEAAIVVFGFSGHSLSGAYPGPGVNGSINRLRYTTMVVDNPARALRPGSP